MNSKAPRTKQRVTILDVAREANVSIGSVSNVLNGSRPVSDELRDQVLEAANRMGFQLNSIAQALRRRRSGVIGLCTTFIATIYLRELAEKLDLIATRNGFDLIQVFTREDPELELRRVRSLLARQVDGLVLLPSLEPHASIEAIRSTNTPVVILDRQGEDTQLNYVIVDNERAMRQIVRSLRGLNHRNILFVVQNLGVITTRHRLAGLETEARESRGALRYEAIERGLDRQLFSERLSRILRGREAPTAIIMGNSSVALWTVEVLQQMGMHWPEDVTLVTFDTPDWAPVLVPPLATIQSPTGEMADQVWSMLTAQIDGKAEKPRTFSVQSELIARGSMGVARAG